MNKDFDEITRDIVDRFLQNILFIDDKAFRGNDETNAFDSEQISKVFAKAGKLCSIFAPKSKDDLTICNKLIEKSDVIVLDWFLELENDSKGNDEEDAECDEPRGRYTSLLIQSIIDDAQDKKLKLVIVYTAETDLSRITESIGKDLRVDSGYIVKEDEGLISSSNVLILIRRKSSSSENNSSRFMYNPSLQDKVVEYEKLPDFISDEFVKFVGGLLPNYALTAITAIRESSSSILGVFSKDIDPAFIVHYILIPDCNDAKSLLSEIIGSSVTNLIDSLDIDMESWIKSWIDKNIHEREIELKGVNKPILVTNEKLKKLLDSSEKFFSSFNEVFLDKDNNLGKNKVIKEITKLFCIQHDNDENLGKEVDENNSNYKWARLVQHSNLFKPPVNPRLTMGTIVKYQASDEADWKYLLCIQQSCDSVRIKQGETRSFLFLPLEKNGDSEEPVVIEDNSHLIVNNKSYSIVLHSFIPKDTDSQIIFKKAQLDNKEQYVFEDTSGQQYIWVASLKQIFAQHIVATYVSKLSRVGIDNSEWLRIVSKK